jgi:glycosyltransferase EpsF
MSSLKIQFDFLLHVNSQNGYEDEIERLGYKIYYTNPMHVKGLFHYVKDMEKLIKENGPYDVVHIHMDSLGGIVALAAKMAGIKHIICHSHSTGVKKTGNCVLLICRALFRLCNVQRVACGSAAGMALFGKRKYVILNNSIDVKGYAHLNESDFIAIRKELNIPIEAKVVVHVGRFDKAKNQMYVVQLADVILKDNPNVYFVFAVPVLCLRR